ncbi:MAG: hypothetical protein EOP56_02725 [Sphingobacteriales bacterium]|nr:MAG: hypothetical protein EOP56_02725 [Sphingobacteriales bacterium]
MQTPFIIRINDLRYLLNDSKDMFLIEGKKAAACSPQLSLDRLRVQQQDWFILWDNQTNGCYELTPAATVLPLSVQWVRIQFETQDTDLQARLTLLILLAESASAIRSRLGPASRPEQALTKAVRQFLSKSN